MGLAASQARFLALTARKADCEFQSMKVAQQKLSVTRELSEISEEYKNAMNATKLVWNFDGESSYDLSYGILMTPTIMNNFDPYLVTTRTGAVVLNSQLASAAAIISPSGAPVARSTDNYRKFIEQLVVAGLIGENLRDEIIKKDVTNKEYSPNVGYGAKPKDKDVDSSNLIGLAYRFKDVKLDDVMSGFITSGNDADEYVTYDDKKVYIYKNNQKLSAKDIKELTVQDILNNNVVVVTELADESETAAYNNDFVETLLNRLVGQDASYTGKTFEDVLGTDAVAKQALTQALFETQQDFCTSTNVVEKSGGKLRLDSRLEEARKEAKDYNASVWYKVDSPLKLKGENKHSVIAVDLNNLFGSLLTYMDLFMNGFTAEDYKVNQKKSVSNLVTDDLAYEYLFTQGEGGSELSNEILMKSDFYMKLFNNICINGWVKNDDVDNNKYLEQMLKNGTFFLSSIAPDGYFYQERYNEHSSAIGLNDETSIVIEVKDEDAIAQAEAEFSAKKIKLTYKEDKLDIEMKNLDAEISSITTEYDSVKNLISKNVEKVFTMFQ